MTDKPKLESAFRLSNVEQKIKNRPMTKEHRMTRRMETAVHNALVRSGEKVYDMEPTKEDTNPVIERAERALARTNDEGFSPEIEQIFMDDLPEIFRLARSGASLGDEERSQRLQDHMEQHHGVSLKASEWDRALKAIGGGSGGQG